MNESLLIDKFDRILSTSTHKKRQSTDPKRNKR